MLAVGEEVDQGYLETNTDMVSAPPPPHHHSYHTDFYHVPKGPFICLSAARRRGSVFSFYTVCISKPTPSQAQVVNL